MSQNTNGHHALINGLNIYYEIHGTGRPLVLLHGGLMTVEAIGPLHAAQMAEDVAGLMRHLELRETDIFGFSLGGTAALRIGSRYPEQVRKLVIVSTPYDNDGFYPSIVASWPSMSVERLGGTPMEAWYRAVAPNPDHFPVLVDTMRSALMSFEGWTADEIKSIEAPTLLAFGDADLIRPEYAVDMFRLLGGVRDDGGTPAAG